MFARIGIAPIFVPSIVVECSSFKAILPYGVTGVRSKVATTGFRPSSFRTTLRCGKAGHICTATWFSTPHPPKGRISAARLCSSNGKYGSPAASTAESEPKGANTAANETVVPRGKRAASLETIPWTEYIKGRRVEQGRPRMLRVNPPR